MGMMSIRRFAKKMLAPVVIVLVVGLTVGMFYIGFPKSQVTSTAYQGPAAKIGGEKISDTKFNDYMMQANQQASQYAQYGLQYTSAQIRDTALQMAIRDYVIQQQIKQLKINVPDSEAEKLIKKYLPSEEELQSYMERQGLANRSAVVKQIVGQLKEQKLYVTNAKKSNIKVSKDEINGYMEEITVSHILVGTKDPSGKDLRSDEEALKRAEEAYQKAANKGDFAALVKEYSDDPGSKDKGGVYGPMPVSQFKGSMVKEFVDGALALKAGEISKPVKTQYGYHIIKLDKRSMPTGKDAKEKYAEIEEGLLVQKYTQSPAYSNWMKKQTTAAEAKLEILDPAIRAYRLAQKEKWAEAAKAYEKALTRKYYKGQWELRLDAAKAYTKSKQFDKAEKVLKGVPAANQDMYEYQVALATIQKENNQLSKAVATMTAYGRKHAQDASTHQQLQQLFTEWKATDAAAKEGEILAKLKKQEEANLQKSQQNLNQKYGQTTEPAVTPEPSATPVASAAADKAEKSGDKATTEKKTKK